MWWALNSSGKIQNVLLNNWRRLGRFPRREKKRPVVISLLDDLGSWEIVQRVRKSHLRKRYEKKNAWGVTN